MRRLTRHEAYAHADVVTRVEIRLRAHDLVRDLTAARDLIFRTDNRAQDIARPLTRAVDQAVILAKNLDHDVDIDLTGTGDLARDLRRAETRVLASDLDSHLVSGPADTLHRANVSLQNLVVNLDRVRKIAVSGAGAAVADGRRVSPGRPAQSMVALTVQLLPVAQRSRYRAEFSVELTDLPRSQQLGYALRVLTGAWKLRTALLESVRTADGELARRTER